ncbi:MAG: hypothetical protein NZ553_10235 [Caldilinea sp.]|nr:hypothetical protein [Caldilinea sp.]MDW8440838.1 hypothetical protein [Caldilineaceae bacterium]
MCSPLSRQPSAIRRFSVNSTPSSPGSCFGFIRSGDNGQGADLLRNGGAIVAGGPSGGSAQDCPDAVGLYEYKPVVYGVSMGFFYGVGVTEQVLTVNVRG